MVSHQYAGSSLIESDWVSNKCTAQNAGLGFVKKSRRGPRSKSNDSTTCTNHVCFNDKALVRTTLHLNDYTEEEFQETWSTPEEMSKSHRDINRFVKKLNRGDTIEEGDTRSVRGLECRTALGAMNRVEVRSRAKGLICKEQERQWESQHFDEEFLSMVYLTVSNQCQIEATARGLQDELAVSTMIEQEM